ncbi:Uncharacterised protein [Mycobacteroides abscessus subsp. abscessus]|nr:Uncharacterised protein [Mycobacteroides abscessus subsp. abscessus]
MRRFAAFCKSARRRVRRGVPGCSSATGVAPRVSSTARHCTRSWLAAVVWTPPAHTLMSMNSSRTTGTCATSTRADARTGGAHLRMHLNLAERQDRVDLAVKEVMVERPEAQSGFGADGQPCK